MAALHRIFYVACLAILVFPWGGCASAPPPPDETGPTLAGLAPGESRTFPYSEGSRLSFPLDLERPRYLHIRLEQRGIDARIIVTDAEGVVVATSRGEAGRWKEEALVAVLEAPGRYDVTLALAEGEDGKGQVALEVVEDRPVGSGDGRRVELENRYSSALESTDAARRVAELREVAAGFASVGAPRRQASALADLGWAHLDTERPDLDATREALAASLALWVEIGDAEGHADILDDIARLAIASQEFDKAARLLAEAGEQAAASGRPGSVAMVENTLGYLAYAQGLRSEALTHFTRAAEHYRLAGDLRNYASALMGMGLLERSQGLAEDEGAALPDGEPSAVAGCLKVEEAMRLAREMRFERSELQINYGLCQRARGRGDAAYAAYTSALDGALASGDDDARGQALFHLGSLLAELGEFEAGRRRLEEARDLLPPNLQVVAETYLGWIAVLEGRPEEGIESFRRAVAAAPESRAAWLGWGDALLHLDRPAEALEPLGRALDLARRAGTKRAEAEALRKVGTAHRELGDLPAARAALTAALETGPREAAPEGATRSQLARLLAAEGRPEEALAELELAMRIREETRSTISHPEVRATYLSRWREDFSLLIDLLLRTGAPEVEALEASERAHARTLQELLLHSRRDGASEPPKPPPELQEMRRRAEAQAGRLGSRLVSDNPDAAEEAELRVELKRVYDELRTLEWRIHEAAGEEATTPQPRGLKEVQALLGDGEALLEYALGEERSFLFVVTRSGLTVHQDLPPADEIAAAVDDLRGHLETFRPHLLRLLHRRARELYSQLLEPAEADLAGIHSLVVVPDRELFYLPFEALVRTSSGSAAAGAPEYVIDRWQVGYVPAATVLAQLREARSGRAPTGGGEALVAFADSRGGQGGESATRDSGSYGPLPASRDEVREIAGLLPPGSSTVYEGEEASLVRLQDPAVLAAQWLHFAVHGFFDDRQPDLSGLMLADGELRAAEIRQLRLAAELVVLSACQTGLGREVWGEELIGLSRAFFAAGAPTVVVSLWRVADRSTATLMVEFYRGLLDGRGPMEALARAKRRLREAGRHPYYWAPFIVIGEPDFAATRNTSPQPTPVSGVHPSHIDLTNGR